MIGPALRLHDYLQHVIDAIGRISLYVGNMDHAAFMGDAKTQDAVIRNLQIIGEAAHNIRQRFPDVVAADPAVPWHSAYGMRNALTHGYFSVDLERVWTTIQNDLPPFEATLRRLLASRP
jgi:uncharacterized protein with HEPN domain